MQRRQNKKKDTRDCPAGAERPRGEESRDGREENDEVAGVAAPEEAGCSEPGAVTRHVSGREWRKYNIPRRKGAVRPNCGQEGSSRALPSVLTILLKNYWGGRTFPEERLPGMEVKTSSLGSGSVQPLKVEPDRAFCIGKWSLECMC